MIITAEIKWVKLTTDMFDNRKIKQIRHLPEGNNIVLIWVMLLTIAGRCNSGGMIFLTENIPYTIESLAIELDFDQTVVKLALDVLQKFGMIVCDQNAFLICGWEEHQNIEGMEKIREQTRQRVAKYREKQRMLMESNVCQYCGNPATGYDHIIARSRGGSDSDDNKVPCCPECNQIKNDKPLVDFLNRNRKRINDQIVMANPKLRRYVTLSNVTGCYIVTSGNDTEEEREIERDKEKDVNSVVADKPQRTRFQPPTVEEVRAYCSEKQYHIDPERFVDYYTSNGWMVGRNKMKDWKAAVRTWVKKEAQLKKPLKTGMGTPEERHANRPFKPTEF